MTTPRKPATARRETGTTGDRSAASRPYLILAYGVAATAIGLLGIWGVVALFSEPPASSSSARRVSRGAYPAMVQPNTAVLFYVGEDGMGLVTREVEVSLGDSALSRARIIAERQLTPPETPLISPFPEGTELRAIYLTTGGDAFVDLSQHVSTGHPGGSLDELFTVYALVNALTTNMPEIAAVQILIEGHEVDTLAGHVDLRRPLGLNMAWVAEGAL